LSIANGSSWSFMEHLLIADSFLQFLKVHLCIV
jgi:hypothetical protein